MSFLESHEVVTDSLEAKASSSDRIGQKHGSPLICTVPVTLALD